MVNRALGRAKVRAISQHNSPKPDDDTPILPPDATFEASKTPESEQLKQLLLNAMPQPYQQGNRDDPRYYLNSGPNGSRLLGDRKFWRLLFRDNIESNRINLPFTNDSLGFDPEAIVRRDLSDSTSFNPFLPPFVNYVGGTPTIGAPMPKPPMAKSPRTKIRADAPQRGKGPSKDKPRPKGARKPPDNRKLV